MGGGLTGYLGRGSSGGQPDPRKGVRGGGARSYRIAISVGVAVLALVTGCGTAAPSSPAPGPGGSGAQPDSSVFGDRTVSIATRTGQRTALVHHPDGVNGGAPLVVVLHGEKGSAAQARDDYGWNALADRERFVVAYPDAENHAWNAGPTCCYPLSAGVNDVGYLNELVSQLTKNDLVDRARVFAVGFSAGASMAYTWECAQPNQLAGIGPVGGALLIDCKVLPAISVAAIHGAADSYFPLAGGPAPHAPPGLPPGRPLEQTLALFRGIDQCPDQPTTTTGPPAAQRSWSCLANHSVSVAVIDGAGHQWPGATPAAQTGDTLGAGADPPSTALNATDWLWAHLRDSRSR